MKIEKHYTSSLSKRTLFEAWISTEMVIEPITKIECNPVVDGILKLYSELPTHTSVMVGRFKEIKRYDKLTYSWFWEGSDEETIVSISFNEENGESIIDLCHEGFLTRESKDMHDAGWDHYFHALVKKIKNSDFEKRIK